MIVVVKSQQLFLVVDFTTTNGFVKDMYPKKCNKQPENDTLINKNTFFTPAPLAKDDELLEHL